MGFLSQIRENWTESCASQKDIEGLRECFNETIDTICECAIPKYFSECADRIKKCYEACESCGDRSVSMINFKNVCHQFDDYKEAMQTYISEMCEKCMGESFDLTTANTEAETLNANASKMVDGLFQDNNQELSESPCQEAVACLESMLEFAEKCESMKESADRVCNELCECGNPDYANRLGKIYYATECGYAMNYLEKCEECFEKVYDCVTNDPVKPVPGRVVF